MGALSALPTPGDANLVWQKVRLHLANATPQAQLAFKGLKEALTTQRRNPNLALATFSAEQLLTADDGLGIGAGTAQVYGIYFKKRDDATDAWFTVVDNGTDDNIYGGSLTASYILAQAAKIASKESAYVFPTGLDILLGIRLASFTTGAAGTTASVAAADSVDGFLIYGAA